MREEDIAEVAALEALVSAQPWSLKLFRGELEMPSAQRLWLLAIVAGSVAGFAGLMFVDEDSHLMNIAVAPDRRRLGLGQTLLAKSLKIARERGACHLTLEVRASNTAALGLYRRFGLAPVGVRKAYYPDGEDALIMWAHDINSDEYGAALHQLITSPGTPS